MLNPRRHGQSWSRNSPAATEKCGLPRQMPKGLLTLSLRMFIFALLSESPELARSGVSLKRRPSGARAVCWSGVLERCVGAMRWSGVLWRCAGVVRWSCALERCIGAAREQRASATHAVRWSAALERCVGALRWSAALERRASGDRPALAGSGSIARSTEHLPDALASLIYGAWCLAMLRRRGTPPFWHVRHYGG